MTTINILIAVLLLINLAMIYVLGKGYLKWKRECYKWVNKYTILNNQFMNYQKRNK